MKQKRHKIILEIIANEDICTQEDLLQRLLERGVETTQATISRDIRELGLKKTQAKKGGQKYTVFEDKPYVTNSSYKHVISTGIISVDIAESLIVLKTVSGVAMAVGAAVDNLKIDGVVGCIAGDDTVFIAVQRKSMMDKIVEEIKNAAKA